MQLEKYSNIIAIIANIVVIISIRQLKYSSKSLKFQAIVHAMEIMKEVSCISRVIYKNKNLIVYTYDDFPKTPPKKRRNSKSSQENLMRIREKQYNNYLSSEEYDSAKKCISLLNDVGALIDNGIIDYKDVLSTYHTVIIRLVSVLEPVRRDIEFNNENSIGGNYGYRILRLYHQSINYNKMYSKHRDVPIYIIAGGNRTCIVPEEKGGRLRKIFISLFYRLRFLKIKFWY